MSIPSDEYNEQIPVDKSIPDGWEDARNSIVERTKELANAINIRPVGWLVNSEILTGKRFIPIDSSQEFRDVFRKTFDVGALPNNTTKNVPHGITQIPENFRLLSMWGASTDTATGASLPLPYASITKNVEIKMDATNIIITTDMDYSPYNESVIFLEYTTRI